MNLFALLFGAIASFVALVGSFPPGFHREAKSGSAPISTTTTAKEVFQKIDLASSTPVSDKKPAHSVEFKATTTKKTALAEQDKKTPLPAPIIVSLPPLQVQEEKTSEISVASSSSPSAGLILPTLRTDEIFRAVVKIECPAAGGVGKYIGSGFVLDGGVVVTAAHLLMASESENCTVIFPKDRKPIYYLSAAIQDRDLIRARHDEEGIDLALLRLPPISGYPEAQSIFSSYPAISYPICEGPPLLGDILFHYGYPANFLNQSYLSMLEGTAVAFADIDGIKDQLSEDGTYIFKSPIFMLSADEERLHPYLISRAASYYGDSGGLAFDATKQCILGPHRGSTIGRDPGDNYTIFILLSWDKVRDLVR